VVGFLTTLVACWALRFATPALAWLSTGVIGLAGSMVALFPRWRRLAQVQVVHAALLVGIMTGEWLTCRWFGLEADPLRLTYVWLTWGLVPVAATFLALRAAGANFRGLLTLRWGSLPGRLWPSAALVLFFALWYRYRFWPLAPTLDTPCLAGGLALSSLVLLLVTYGVLLALLEELLYRGFLLSVLRRELGWRPAVVFQALVYGAIYSRPDILPNGPTAGVAMGLVALALGLCAQKSEGLAWPVIVHFCVNVIVLCFA